jgi:NhaP-type Na+/H+ or K+/H+ antiporter
VVVDSGEAFDHCDEIILISAFVVVVSIFGFGLPLPAVLRHLNFAHDDSRERELRLATGREVLIDLRDRGEIGDEVRRIVENNFEIEELRVSG